MSVTKIVLIGAGRVATQLGKALKSIDKKIVQVYSRTMESASRLAAELGSTPETNLTKIDRNADLYLISVSDDAISEIAASLSLEGKIVAHTSGSVAMDTLKLVTSRHGVFYPLNTFSTTKAINLAHTPICIEAADKSTEEQLLALGRSISGDVRLINSEQRSMIHIAAVFACNFSNFMFVNAAEVLKNANVSFDILMPLINETVDKLKEISPEEAQTGPAFRNDLKVLEKHIGLLTKAKAKMLIYKMLSDQINDFFKKKQQKLPK
jgi:predicted short-subunit dehydrogenase-like oxidoreductase (DUF2520 family)